MVKTAFVLECHMALLGNLACYARVPYGTLGSERANCSALGQAMNVMNRGYDISEDLGLLPTLIFLYFN